LVRVNEDLLTSGISGQPFPPLYQSGIVYRPEPPGQENWQTAEGVYSKGHGDCEDLSAIRCAELRLSNQDPHCVVHIYKSGPRRYHAVVKRGSGEIEDPTKILKAIERKRRGPRLRLPKEKSEEKIYTPEVVEGTPMEENQEAILGYYGSGSLWQQGAYDPYASVWAQAGYQTPGGQYYGAQQYGQTYPYGGFADPYGMYGGMYGLDPYQAAYYGSGYGYPQGYDVSAAQNAYQPYGYDPYQDQYQQQYVEQVQQYAQEVEAEAEQQKQKLQERRQRIRQREQQLRQRQRERLQQQREQQRQRREQQRQRREQQQERRRERQQRRQQWRQQQGRRSRRRGWVIGEDPFYPLF
jgi:hypothetical protein